MTTLPHLAAAMAIPIFSAGAGIAADPATKHKGETSTYTGWPFGLLVAKWGADLEVTGSFDNNGMFWAKGVLENLNFVGVWTASIAPRECDTEHEGTRYWGRVRFIMREQGRIFVGKWSYCDSQPSIAFQAKWTGD